MFSIVFFFFLVTLGDGAAGVLGVSGFLLVVGFFGVTAGDCVVILDAAADIVGSVDVVAAGDSVVVVLLLLLPEVLLLLPLLPVVLMLFLLLLLVLGPWFVFEEGM